MITAIRLSMGVSEFAWIVAAALIVGLTIGVWVGVAIGKAIAAAPRLGDRVR